jgi:uncharacterized membrane protein (DUF106 family)
MTVKIDTNGGGFRVGLPVLVMIISVIVSLAVTLDTKVDRDKVEACENRIVTLETEMKGIDKDLAKIDATLEKLNTGQTEILRKISRIEGMQETGR